MYIIETDPQTQSQIQKYQKLSENGKNIVNITLNSFYEIEKKSN